MHGDGFRTSNLPERESFAASRVARVDVREEDECPRLPG
jgi:hypothetical protein